MYKGPHIEAIPQGWLTLDQLRDNLVEYMMIQSPYKDLAKEDMPANMIEQMESSMTRLALAIWNVSSSSPGSWLLALNNVNKEQVNNTNPVVNFIHGLGINLTWQDFENGQAIKISVDEGLLNNSITEIVKNILGPILDIDMEGDDYYQYITYNITGGTTNINGGDVTINEGDTIINGGTVVVSSPANISDPNHESFIIESTTETNVTIRSSWTVIHYSEQVGEFKATIMVRNKSLHTIKTVIALLSFDYTEDPSVVLQSDILTSTPFTIVVGVDVDNYLYATISDMPTDEKRIHICFERCVLSTRPFSLHGTINGSSSITGYLIGAMFIQGTINSSSEVTGTLSQRNSINVVVVGSSEVTGILNHISGMEVIVETNTIVTGTISGKKSIAGIINSSSEVTGNLTPILDTYELLLELQTNSPNTTTFDPSIVASSGTYKWDVGGVEFVGKSLSTVLDGTTKTVKLYGKGSCKIEEISLYNDKVLGTVDLSNNAFKYTQVFNFGSNLGLTNLIFPLTHYNSTKQINLQYTGISGNLDLTHFNNWEKAYISIGCPIDNLYFPTTITGSCFYLDISNCNNLTQLDISMVKVFTVEVSKYANGQIYITNNSQLSNIVWPTTVSGNIFSFTLANCPLMGDINLSAFNNWYTDSTLLIYSSSVGDIILSPNASSIKSININNITVNGTTIDISGVSIRDNGNIILQNITGVDNVYLPDTPTGNVLQLYMDNVSCSNTLDLTFLSNTTSDFEVQLSNLINVSTIITPISTSGTVKGFVIDNVNMASLNISWLTTASYNSNIQFRNCTNLVTVITPTTITGNLNWFSFEDCPVLGYISMLIFDGILIIDDSDIVVQNCNWSADKVNRALYELSTWVPGITPGNYSAIHFENDSLINPNSAPDSSSGGYNGLAAKATLISVIECYTE